MLRVELGHKQHQSNRWRKLQQKEAIGASQSPSKSPCSPQLRKTLTSPPPHSLIHHATIIRSPLVINYTNPIKESKYSFTMISHLIRVWEKSWKPMINGEALHPPVVCLSAVLSRKSTHPLLTKVVERLAAYKNLPRGRVSRANYIISACMHALVAYSWSYIYRLGNFTTLACVVLSSSVNFSMEGRTME